MRVQESFPLSYTGRVDRTGAYPIVRGVLLCGEKSKWGRQYQREAFASPKIYEGKSSFLNHQSKPGNRDVESKIAWVVSESRNADGLPIGDVGFNPKHPYTESTLWLIENRPADVMMSHVADVDESVQAGGQKSVTKINEVFSVDFVTNGATTKSIFEGAPVKMVIKDYLKKIAPHAVDVDKLIRLRKLVREEGIEEMEMMDGPGMDGEMNEEMAEEGLDHAFGAACMKEIDECIENLSKPEHVKKCLMRLKKILRAHGDLNEEMGEEEEPEDEETEEEIAVEGAPKKKAKAKLVKEEAPEVKQGRVLHECVEEGWSPSKEDLPVLAGIANIASKEDRLAAIRRQKGLSRATMPKGSNRETVVAEAAPNKDGQIPKNLDSANSPEAVAAFVRAERMKKLGISPTGGK